jgi:hypothetical protein
LLAKCSIEINTETALFKPKLAKNTDKNYYLEWLLICIRVNDIDLFKILMEKYFFSIPRSTIYKYLDPLVPSEGEPIITLAIKQENISFIKILLDCQLDLTICDKSNQNAVMVALGTKNCYLIKLIRNYMADKPMYAGMMVLMDIFIDLLEKNELCNIFSIYDTCVRIWTSLEYWYNYIVHTLRENDCILNNPNPEKID